MAMFSRRSAYVKNPILELDSAAEQLTKKGKEIIKLNRGDPPLYFKTPRYMIDAYVQALRENQTNYSRAAGTKELVSAVIGRYARLYKARLGEDDIIATAGVTEALAFLNHMLMERGDRAILFRPYYPQYIPRLMSEGGVPIYCNQEMGKGWEMDLDGVERKLKAARSAGSAKRLKYMIITNPGNPTGRVLGRATLKAIAGLANEYGFLLVSDEIYDEIVYNGAKFTSMVQVAKGVPHVVLNGSSKNLDSTGFRIGYAIVPENDAKSEAVKRKLMDYALTRLSLNTPAQHAVAVGLSNVAQHKRAISSMVEGIRARVGAVTKALAENPLIEVVEPNSTFYVFPRVDLKGLDFKSGDEFVRAALFEAGVQLTRGSAFGTPSNFRIVALPDEKTLESAVSRINAMCRKHRKR